MFDGSSDIRGSSCDQRVVQYVCFIMIHLCETEYPCMISPYFKFNENTMTLALCSFRGHVKAPGWHRLAILDRRSSQTSLSSSSNTVFKLLPSHKRETSQHMNGHDQLGMRDSIYILHVGLLNKRGRGREKENRKWFFVLEALTLESKRTSEEESRLGSPPQTMPLRLEMNPEGPILLEDRIRSRVGYRIVVERLWPRTTIYLWRQKKRI